VAAEAAAAAAEAAAAAAARHNVGIQQARDEAHRLLRRGGIHHDRGPVQDEGEGVHAAVSGRAVSDQPKVCERHALQTHQWPVFKGAGAVQCMAAPRPARTLRLALRLCACGGLPHTPPGCPSASGARVPRPIHPPDSSLGPA
jgi:hypothetical protein